MPLLELLDVQKSFPGTSVLAGGSLTIDEGELVAVVGYSGAGKSTLVNLAAGLVAADAGTVRFDGKPVTGPDRERGIVFQTYALLPWLTVEQNVALAVDACFPERSAADRKAHVRKYVAMVGLEPAMAKTPSQLSGGMRQRVSLARALAMESRLLLLDEPLSALDALTRANLQDELASIVSKSGRTMLLVTNDVDEAILLADRIIPLEHGPGARLGPSYVVDVPRPRTRADARRDPRWKALHHSIVGFLRASASEKRGGRKIALPGVATPEPEPELAEVRS